MRQILLRIQRRAISYLLIADGGVAAALLVNAHKGISQRLDCNSNLHKVVERNIALAYISTLKKNESIISQPS